MFGAAFLISLILLLSPVLAAYQIGNIDNINPFTIMFGPFAAFISGIGIFIIILVASSLWVGPTIVLLVLGIVSGPKDEEDQQGIGKKAFWCAVAVLILIFGFLTFLLLLSVKITQFIGFIILAITLLIDAVIFAFAFRDKKRTIKNKWQENEDPSGISKKVSGLVLLIVITIAGFMFFFSVQDNTSRILILIFTFVLDFFILDAATKEKENEEVDVPEIYTRKSRYSDNHKEEEGSKSYEKSKEESSKGESYKRFMPDAKEAEEKGLNDTTMYCSNCGKKISEDAVFCKYCGNKL